MKKYITALSLGLGIMSGFSAYATASPNTDYKGLKFGSESDPYWFKVNGALQVDERLFFGNKRGDLHSGASIRKFDLDLTAGMPNDLSFTLGVGFQPSHSKVEVNDAYVTYAGFKGLGDNFHISVGKVNPSFCLENHSSSKWIPFLERSIATTAFRPDSGLGVSVNKWQDNYSINATIVQPSPDDKTKDEKGNEISKSDRLQANVRGTKAHFWGDHKFVQIGVSGHIKDDGHMGIKFATGPEAKSRHSTTTLFDTEKSGPAGTLNKLIKANSHYTVGVELMGQDGPLSAQGEYLLTRINRDKSQSGNNLGFSGYYANVNYVLTGESRAFDPSQGTLGRVTSDKECGAWEISGRYSFLNLNDKDIVGGAGHNIGAALTWYANYNIAVTCEYIKSLVKKRITLEKIHVDTVGARLQLVF